MGLAMGSGQGYSPEAVPAGAGLPKVSDLGDVLAVDGPARLRYIYRFGTFGRGCQVAGLETKLNAMTLDKSLKRRGKLVRQRSVLSRPERIQRLKEADRWTEGDGVLGLPKVRVYKLVMKKKKVKKEEEGAEGEAAAAPAAGAGDDKKAKPAK